MLSGPKHHTRTLRILFFVLCSVLCPSLSLASTALSLTLNQLLLQFCACNPPSLPSASLVVVMSQVQASHVLVKHQGSRKSATAHMLYRGLVGCCSTC